MLPHKGSLIPGLELTIAGINPEKTHLLKARKETGVWHRRWMRWNHTDGQDLTSCHPTYLGCTNKPGQPALGWAFLTYLGAWLNHFLTSKTRNPNIWLFSGSLAYVLKIYQCCGRFNRSKIKQVNKINWAAQKLLPFFLMYVITFVIVVFLLDFREQIQALDTVVSLYYFI